MTGIKEVEKIHDLIIKCHRGQVNPDIKLIAACQNATRDLVEVTGLVYQRLRVAPDLHHSSIVNY